MICSSENRFFMSNLLLGGDWTSDRRATQNRGTSGLPPTYLFDSSFIETIQISMPVVAFERARSHQASKHRGELRPA